ncbi:MAG: CocE/NonD family hydrolase [Pseudomonadota bacterium]
MLKTALVLIGPVLLSLTLAACGSSGSSNAGVTPGTGAPVAGKSTDMMLVSKVDGEAISFTIHEPTTMRADGKYPLILQSHGYGGTKEDAAKRPTLSALYKGFLDRGYGFISIDERGHGDSGGTIRILEPEKEGQDLLQIIDWAEANLPWLAYRDGNLLLGATGGSYGGGFQHLVYAIDPKHRLDAIAPEITWNDLRYSLFNGGHHEDYSNGVFKTFWVGLLSAAGNAAGGGGNVDPEVNEGLVQGLTMNSLDDEKKALLYKNSLASYCAGKNPNGTLTKIDALYWQSPHDTLFNLTEAVRNFECVSAKGGDVRLLTKIGGHDSLAGGGSGEFCGKLKKDIAILDWYDEKLKGVSGKAAYIPKFCWHMDASADDGVVTTTLPTASTALQMPAQTLALQDGSVQTSSIVLMKIGAGGAVLAGIPTIDLQIGDMVPTAPEVGDPIVFVALAKRAAGATSDTLLMGNQVTPFRGYGSFKQQLIGVTSRLNENDELRLVVQASYALRYAGSGSDALTPVSVEATVNLPLLPGNLPAAPAN